MRFRSRFFCAAFSLLLTVSAHAGSAVILYQTTSLGGSLYRYDYSVFNNAALGPGVSMQLFDIFFDPSLYDETSLLPVTPSPVNTEWSEQILFSVPPLPAVYDVFALSGGIPDGGGASGFAVQFLWLGQGIPGSQSFRIYDQNFDPALSGTTVPEPSMLYVAGISLAFGLWRILLGRRHDPQRVRLGNSEG